MLHFMAQNRHLYVSDLEQLPGRDATVHVSSNSRLNTRIVPSPCPAFVRKIALGAVFLYKLTSHTTAADHTTAVTRTSKGGAHREEPHPSRPSTLINPYSKLAHPCENGSLQTVKQQKT